MKVRFFWFKHKTTEKTIWSICLAWHEEYPPPSCQYYSIFAERHEHTRIWTCFFFPVVSDSWDLRSRLSQVWIHKMFAWNPKRWRIPMGLIYLPTWMVDVYGKLVGKSTVRPMDPSWVNNQLVLMEAWWFPTISHELLHHPVEMTMKHIYYNMVVWGYQDHKTEVVWTHWFQDDQYRAEATVDAWILGNKIIKQIIWRRKNTTFWAFSSWTLPKSQQVPKIPQNEPWLCLWWIFWAAHVPINFFPLQKKMVKHVLKVLPNCLFRRRFFKNEKLSSHWIYDHGYSTNPPSHVPPPEIRV